MTPRTPTALRRMAFALAALALGSALAGCGASGDTLTVAAPAAGGGTTQSLPAFEGRYVVGSWAEDAPALIETIWDIDYDSAESWSTEALSTTSPVTPLMRESLRDGKLETAVVDPQVPAEGRDAKYQGDEPKPEIQAVDGPRLPASWLHPYDVAKLRTRANWTVTELDGGGWQLVEVLQLGCESKEKAPDGPSIFWCQAGATSITEETTYELDADGLPRSVEVRYDGELVGFSRFKSLTLREQ